MKNNKYFKIPLIGKMIEKRERKKRVNEMVNKHPYFKSEEYYKRNIEFQMNKMREKNEMFERIRYFFSYVFLYPLSKIFNIISFVSRVGMFISVITFFIGGKDLINLIFKNGYSCDIKKMIAFLVAPFVFAFFSYAFGFLSDKCWDD